MDYWCRLGNSSTVSGYRDPEGTVGPSYSLIVETSFFLACELLFSILTPLFLPSSSVSLSYFIIAIPLHECLGKHSCMSFIFPIAILN